MFLGAIQDQIAIQQENAIGRGFPLTPAKWVAWRVEHRNAPRDPEEFIDVSEVVRERDMLNHQRRVHEVERSIREWERQLSYLLESHNRTLLMLAREADHLVRNIGAHHF